MDGFGFDGYRRMHRYRREVDYDWRAACRRLHSSCVTMPLFQQPRILDLGILEGDGRVEHACEVVASPRRLHA
jgi:hypothetical protein